MATLIHQLKILCLLLPHRLSVSLSDTYKTNANIKPSPLKFNSLEWLWYKWNFREFYTIMVNESVFYTGRSLNNFNLLTDEKSYLKFPHFASWTSYKTFLVLLRRPIIILGSFSICNQHRNTRPSVFPLTESCTLNFARLKMINLNLKVQTFLASFTINHSL